MENVGMAKASTLKKKRNRTQKKTKSQAPEVVTVKPVFVKENNATPGVCRLPEGQQQEEGSLNNREKEFDVGNRARNPNHRRKRKPKEVRDTKNNAVALEPPLFEGVCPAIQQFPREICANVAIAAGRDYSPGVKKPSVDVNNYVKLKPVDCPCPFPANNLGITNVSLDEIFPGSDVFAFQETNISFGKLTNPSLPKAAAIVSAKQTKLTTGLYSESALLNITFADVFPNDPLVGLQLKSAQAENLVFEHPKQQQENAMKMNTQSGEAKPNKTREEILAEREAKKAAKLAAKNKNKDKTNASLPVQQPKLQPTVVNAPNAPAQLSKSGTDGSICEKLKELHISDDPVRSKAERRTQFETQNESLDKKACESTKPALSKAERRAIQEAQRAAKVGAQQAKKLGPAIAKDASKPTLPRKGSDGLDKTITVKANQPTKKFASGVVGAGGPPRKHIVNLFNHLHQPKFAAAAIVNSPTLHPAVTKLGIQYAEGSVVGSKARCLAMLKMLTQLINDYKTPAEKEFGRSFEESLNTSTAYLQRCRPFSVSMTNALRHVKMYTRQLDAKMSDSKQKEFLLESIESYIRDQIEKAEEAICISVQEKIFDGDVILTYGCSSLIKHILEEANRRLKNFRLIIINARPREEEHAMLEQLVQQGVKCTCVLINAVSYVMPEVTKVLLGAHALLANGSVMSRVGTAQIALVAKSYNVPVLVCCETHKFTERVQTDAFVYNEIGNPNDLVLAPRTRALADAKPMLAGWETLTSLTILNLHYDVTPPELVTAVVTEIAILPCTSVPVILRMKPSDVAY